VSAGPFRFTIKAAAAPTATTRNPAEALMDRNPPPDLAVTLGRLRLKNPVLVASGTFGYAREMEGIVNFEKLGGIIPKTVTRQPRAGNVPPRTVETASGMLNAIGLDNDGLDHFLAHHLPYLRTLPTAIVANIAGKNEAEFIDMAGRIGREPGLAALELNLSCPNVAGGVDFATDPQVTARVVRGVRAVCPLPVLAKLTPNVTDIVPIARAAADAGADAVSLVNTFVGMAVDWRWRRPVLGNVTGGLSGPAIKPLALRLVWQVARQVEVPVVGVGGIATLDDVMEFLVAGAAAVQLGTVNFYDPTASGRIVDELPAALARLGATSVRDVVGTLQVS
jgi:dihydroorotate dehydrogenase (NAD+) catalytic subunit